MTDPTPSGDPAHSARPDAGDTAPPGSTKAPLAIDEQPEPTPWERAKKAYDLISDIITPQTLFILLAAGVIGITGLFGGWSTIATAEKDLPAAPANEPYAAAPFDLVLTSARTAEAVETVALPDLPDSRYLVVAATVTNTSDRAVHTAVLQRAVQPRVAGLATLPGRDVLLAPRIWRTADLQPGGYLQPGLPTRLVLIYTQDAAVPAPTDLPVAVAEQTYRASSIDASTDWRDPTPTAVVTVPCQPMEG